MFELDGYPKEALLPDYRKISRHVLWSFYRAFGRGVEELPIQETDIPRKGERDHVT